MSVWVCANCDHEYDSEEGDLPHGISAGTALEDLPKDWVCPDCGAPKFDFTRLPGSPLADGSGWSTRS